jgi:hypothetical protein
MPDEHSEFRAILRAFTAKPLVVRSLAWAAIFVAIGLLLHPTYVVNSVRYATDYPDATIRLIVFASVALLFGLALAKLTEQICVRPEKPSTIEATEFVLRHSGKVLARFGVSGPQTEPFPTLMLYDTDGTMRAEVSPFGVLLVDEKGQLRTTLAVLDKASSLLLVNGAKDSFALLKSSQDGTELSLGGPKKERAVLEAKDDGPCLTFKDSEANDTVVLGGGLSSLSLVDTLSESGSLELTAFEEPSIRIKDGDGKEVWTAPPSNSS